MNAMPVFWPTPAKLNPDTVNSESTLACSVSRKWCSTVLATSTVRGSTAPDGKVQIANAMPWSSLGRNPVGIRNTSHAIAPTIPT
jgi:hypothetical protein